MKAVNRLTFCRLWLATMAIVAIIESHLLWALFCLTIAYLTDVLDGQIARRCGQETRFGGALDHFMDVFLVASAYITLAARDLPIRIPAWVCCAVVASVLFDGLVWTLFMLFGKETRQVSTPRTSFGRWVFVLQALGLGVVLIQDLGWLQKEEVTLFLHGVGVATVVLLFSNAFVESYQETW